MAFLFRSRLNWRNVFHRSVGILQDALACPRTNATDWHHSPIKHFEQLRRFLLMTYGIGVPIIPDDSTATETIYSLSQSPYRQFRSTLTITLQRRYVHMYLLTYISLKVITCNICVLSLSRREVQMNVEANPDYYANYQEFLADCAKRPEELMVHAKYIKEKPRGFDHANYGTPWPANGVLLTWIRLPSSNLSMTQAANDRQVCLVWTSEESRALNLENQLRYYAYLQLEFRYLGIFATYILWGYFPGIFMDGIAILPQNRMHTKMYVLAFVDQEVRFKLNYIKYCSNCNNIKYFYINTIFHKTGFFTVHVLAAVLLLTMPWFDHHQ